MLDYLINNEEYIYKFKYIILVYECFLNKKYNIIYNNKKIFYYQFNKIILLI